MHMETRFLFHLHLPSVFRLPFYRLILLPVSSLSFLPVSSLSSLPVPIILLPTQRRHRDEGVMDLSHLSHQPVFIPPPTHPRR